VREGSHLTQQIGKSELEFEDWFSRDPADRKGELEFEGGLSLDPAYRKG
jgi:hypothetical protein